MAKEDSPTPLAGKAIEKLGLSPTVQRALLEIQANLTSQYQRSFVEMTEAIQRQASALERLQQTLNILIGRIEPKLVGQLPAAVRVADGDEDADLATAVVVADPIGAGYTMTQTDLAKALNLSQADVSALVKAFKLSEDGECAVVVRRGKTRDIVNYHARAIRRFKQLVANPPRGLKGDAKTALNRVRETLILSEPDSD